MQAIANAIGWVLDKIVGLATFITSVFTQAFKDAWEFITDAFVWVFDQTLGIAVSALGAIDVSAISAQSGTWQSLPSNVLEVVSALGLGQALGVIGAAILIRFTLQLIPFVRLGS